MQCMPPAHNPCNINVSSTRSDSCRKSSWQLTTVPSVACRSNLSQSQDHLFPFLACILSIYTKQMAETHTEARNGSRGITLSFTPSEAAVGGAQLTKAQGVSTDKHSLPTSTGNITFPMQKPLKRHTHTITVRMSRQLLPMELRSRRTPAAVGKAEHNAHKGKRNDYPFIWQRCPELASCLQDWMATPHRITKSCGST